MKISQIIQETSTTVAGSVAPTEMGFVKMQTRNPSVYGNTKAGNLLKGKKTNKAFANSVNESAEISEAHLEEEDIVVVPGQGRSRKNGLVPHGKSRVDHEVEMARSDLFSAAKNAKKVYSMIKDVSEDEGLDGWVQEKIIKANDYLNTIREYLEGKQVQGMNEGSATGRFQLYGVRLDSKKKVPFGSFPTVDAAMVKADDLDTAGFDSIDPEEDHDELYLLDTQTGQKFMYTDDGVNQEWEPIRGKKGVAENEGKLDELSPKALGSYVKSASGDMAKRTGDTQFQKGARVATSAFTSKQQPGRFEKDDKIEKRQDGINRAVNKITGKN